MERQAVPTGMPCPSGQLPSNLIRLPCYQLFLYLTRVCFFDSQLFEHQADEDGDFTTRDWAADLDPAPEGENDPDDDDNIPIP